MALTVGAHGVVLTYDDYAQIPDDRQRYELIEGVLYVSPAPSRWHQFTATALTSIVFNYTRLRQLGEVYGAPFDVVLGETTVAQPDMLFVSRERLAILTDANVQGAPDLVVEVISPSSTVMDQRTKRQVYAQYGVPNYWLVHPLEQWARALVLRDGDYVLVAEVQGDQTFCAPPFPDLTIALSDIWGF